MATENVKLTLSTMTREQYVERSKERARALLRAGRIREAVASMILDMRSHPSCGVPAEIHAVGIYAATTGDTAATRDYIEGFA